MNLKSMKIGQSVLTVASAPKDMVDGYLECALWSSTDESDESGGEPMDKNYDISDIDRESVQKAEKDCSDFLHKAKEEWLEDMDMSLIGHNFWLNRNGHGSGFWDEDKIKNKEYRKLLSDLCKHFRELNPYVGDDGKIYIE